MLVRTARLLSRELNLALREIELTGEQVALLDAIEEIPSPRSKDVCLALGLDPSTISTNIKPLLQRELILTRYESTDRRAKRLELTSKGRTILLSARAILAKIDNELREKLEEHGSLDSVTLALKELC